MSKNNALKSESLTFKLTIQNLNPSDRALCVSMYPILKVVLTYMHVRPVSIAIFRQELLENVKVPVD